jgi:hypothetical protein
MEWTTLIAGLAGAAIATVTALLTEQRRDRREATTEWRRTRLEMYAPFLTGLAQACGEMVSLAKSKQPMTEEEREELARRSFSPCYELRHRFELVASDAVVEPVLDYFRQVRLLRNFVISSDYIDREALERLDNRVFTARAAAIAAMRADLTPVLGRRVRGGAAGPESSIEGEAD